MIDDRPANDVLAGVVIALDEDEVPIWLAQWCNSPGPLRERMNTEVLLAAVTRKHNDPQLREELMQFNALVDAMFEGGNTLHCGREGEGDSAGGAGRL